MIVKKEYCFLKNNLLRLFFFTAISLFFLNTTLAQGDLLIFPKRVVFEGKNKVAQVILSNTGKDSAVYNVSFVQYRMTEEGAFQIITAPDAGQNFATPYVRVFPRQVTLAPGESQTVKVQVVNTNSLADGEYRSHLYFRAEKNQQPLGSENKSKDSTSIAVKLEAVYGISIPTIITKGISHTTVTIDKLSYSKEGASQHFLYFNLNRSGNMSAYGDITVYYISSEGKSYEVGNVRGIAVYTPGNVRKIKLAVQQPNGIHFSGGMFTVKYTQNESNKVLAEAALEL